MALPHEANSIPLALTYDDVLLEPRHSRVRSRSLVNIQTPFTRQIRLGVPLVSANMDTVTEWRMAVAMAEFGGIGVIHRFLPIERQAEEVRRVKRYRGHVIEDPATISPDATIDAALQQMQRLDISGLVVVDKEGMIEGILTARDVRSAELRDKVKTRMTPKSTLITAPADVSMEAAQQVLDSHRLEKLPLVDKAGRLRGLITASDIAQTQGLSLSTVDPKGRLRVAAAIGVSGDTLERAEALVAAGADALVIDVAHGDSDLVLETLARVRERLGPIPLVAGNVATGDAVERLAQAGADAIKVGIGPGSMCTTRVVTGVGVPQLTAILNCAAAAEPYGIPTIADGGIRSSGDIAKALAAGAAGVMLGALLAGTEESPGIVLTRKGHKVKVARGMASAEAMVDRAYRNDPTLGWSTWGPEEPPPAPEGVQAAVPYTGPVMDILRALVAGLRSGMSYCDANTLEELRRNARFIRISEAGKREGDVHDVDPF